MVEGVGSVRAGPGRMLVLRILNEGDIIGCCHVRVEDVGTLVCGFWDEKEYQRQTEASEDGNEVECPC